MSPFWKFRMTPLMVGLAIAVVGLAGSASDAAAGALPKDPCALLKPTEVQAALAPNANIGSGSFEHQHVAYWCRVHVHMATQNP